MSVTSIAVELCDGRHRAVLRSGLLRPVQMGSGPQGCTVGLVATSALLLGGDHVQICVEVGAGARLDLRDIAGTVAYDGRGAPCRWDVQVSVGAGGVLRWGGEPFVVAAGALVLRTLRVDAAAAAQVSMRETLVLGRSDETGGRLANRSQTVVDGVTVHREDLDLLDPELRAGPGMLGDARVIDTVLSVGPSPPMSAGAAADDRHQATASEHLRPSGAPSPAGLCHRFRLTGDAGTVTRFLGLDLASSPLHRFWASGS